MTDQGICFWQFIEDCDGSGHYETDCGNAFYFSNDGNLADNEFHYCPFCGRDVLETM